MRVWMRAAAAAAIVMALSGGAWAQADLEQGKSAAQLFASDCGICHKSAQALVKDGYPTEAFLRVHYTSSREMASALFTYLRGIARADSAAAPKRGKKATTEKAGEGKPTTERKPKKPESEQGQPPPSRNRSPSQTAPALRPKSGRRRRRPSPECSLPLEREGRRAELERRRVGLG